MDGARTPHRLRTRLPYLALALLTIVLGLAVHLRGGWITPDARDVLGDGLWAAMIAWWVGAIVPGASLRTRLAVALGVCFAVETSQLYHAPWIDALRGTRVGHLVLGSDFDARDLLAYSLGVLTAAAIERLVWPGARTR